MSLLIERYDLFFLLTSYFRWFKAFIPLFFNLFHCDALAFALHHHKHEMIEGVEKMNSSRWIKFKGFLAAIFIASTAVLVFGATVNDFYFTSIDFMNKENIRSIDDFTSQGHREVASNTVAPLVRWVSLSGYDLKKLSSHFEIKRIVNEKGERLSRKINERGELILTEKGFAQMEVDASPIFDENGEPLTNEGTYYFKFSRINGVANVQIGEAESEDYYKVLKINHNEGHTSITLGLELETIDSEGQRSAGVYIIEARQVKKKKILSRKNYKKLKKREMSEEEDQENEEEVLFPDMSGLVLTEAVNRMKSNGVNPHTLKPDSETYGSFTIMNDHIESLELRITDGENIIDLNIEDAKISQARTFMSEGANGILINGVISLDENKFITIRFTHEDLRDWSVRFSLPNEELETEVEDEYEKEIFAMELEEKKQREQDEKIANGENFESIEVQSQGEARGRIKGSAPRTEEDREFTEDFDEDFDQKKSREETIDAQEREEDFDEEVVEANRVLNEKLQEEDLSFTENRPESL